MLERQSSVLFAVRIDHNVSTHTQEEGSDE